MTWATRLVGTVTAALLSAAVGVVALPGAAQAAACTNGSGYTVVVDPQQLGSGSSTTCVGGSGRQRASALFREAGVALDFVSGSPGFVCRVNGAPASAGCVETPPDNAYWSLWWSTGDGTWVYASSGVSGQKVPEGGWVAWSWQGQSARRAPGVSPSTPVAAAPQPTERPTTRPTSGSDAARGSKGSGQATPRPSASTEPSATPSPSTAAQKKAARKAKAEASASASADSSTASSEDAARASSESDGGPGGLAWVAIVVLLALGISGGVVAWRRRTSADL